MRPDLRAALASGAIAVTPNRRLARHLQREFAKDALAEGRRTWPTPTILPYGAWLESLWLELIAAEALPDPPRLLRPVQSAYAWQRIAAGDSRNTGIDHRSAAKLAGEAWQLLHAWGAGGESWRGWPALGLSDDQAAFVSWAESYAATLNSTRAIDAGRLADILALNATALKGTRRCRVLLIGFVELSPQQTRLEAALAAAGAVHFERVDPLPTEQARAWRTTGATSRDEIARALAWACSQVAARPRAVVGIAVEDLARRRAEIWTLAEEILSPALQWPGSESVLRPFNISLGDSLGATPLVSSALDLIELALRPIPSTRAAAALRSPYLAAAQSFWTRRAVTESRWLERGRHEISFGDAIGALADADPMLAERWRRARSGERMPRSASPREWVDAWRDWLDAIGWPGDAALGSAEYQTRRAWDDLLVEFGALAAVETRLVHGEALAILRALAAERVFQPEVKEVPVQILGLLEAQGLAFDALWVAGLSAERWPPEPEPNPLLPLAWQREHGLPRSSAAREIAYARTLTDRFLRAAPCVVFSHVEGSEEAKSMPSALILDLPALDTEEVLVPPTAAERIRAVAPRLEEVDDEFAPSPIPGQRMSGGAALFEKQSECPFRAVTIHRLEAELWPEAPEGLSPLERGDLLHRVFAALWNDLRDRDTLLTKSPTGLKARVDGAVAQAMSSNAVPVRRWQSLPPLSRELESERLSKLTLEWLEKHERKRAPFRVVDTELKLSLAFELFHIDLRLDRIDALEGGGVAIIDYKSGRVVSVARWFDPRPQAPQLALYAVAWRCAHPYEAVRAVAYAQVRRGELKLEGIAADDTAWPELNRPAKLRNVELGDWRAVEAHWHESLGALAAEIGRGRAAVAPREGSKTCNRCRLYALCRIGTPASEESETDDGEA